MTFFKYNFFNSIKFNYPHKFVDKNEKIFTRAIIIFIRLTLILYLLIFLSFYINLEK